MLKQIHIYIKGDVIGVGFRAWTKIQAKVNLVSGWVKNTFNNPNIFGNGGGVEALLQGEEGNINKLLDIIKKGSPISRVEGVEVFFQEPKEMFEGFEIKK